MTVRTYLVDDNLTFLKAVNGFLAQLPHVEVLGQSTHGFDALARIEQAKPDLVLLDLALPDINGIDVGLSMSFWTQPPHIIILTMHDSAGYMALAQKLGAMAFVNKADFVKELSPLLELLGSQASRGTTK